MTLKQQRITRLPWHNRVPRTRLYLKNSEIAAALLRLLLCGPRRGTSIDMFAKEFSKMLGGVRPVAGPSARACLYHVLKALDLPPGSDVIVSPITVHDMINAILLAGHRPVFVDIDPRTYQMDSDALGSAITDNTRVVLLTHLFGIPSEMNRIVPLCERKGIAILEDASHSLNAAVDGQKVGTFGAAGVFSLSSLKVVSCGYGGVIVSRNEGFLDRTVESLSRLRPAKRGDLRGILIKDLVIGLACQRAIFSCATFPLIHMLNMLDPGIVSKLQTDNPEWVRLEQLPAKWCWQFSPAQARLGMACLERLEQWDKKRQANAQILMDTLLPLVPERLPRVFPGANNVFWRFPFRAPEGKKFQRFMSNHGVDVTTTLLPCCNKIPTFSDFAKPMPNAEQAVEEVYFLPVHPTLRDDQVRSMAKCVAEFLKRGA